MTDRARASRLSMLAFVLASLPAIVTWLPLGSRSTDVSTDANGPIVTVDERITLLANEGWTVPIPSLIASLLALVPVLVAHRATARTTPIVIVVVFAPGVAAGLASIGMFFVPALFALIAAAGTDDRTFKARHVSE